MAGHLAKAGYDVGVFNRTFEKSQRWAQKHGGEAAKTIADAVRDADIVMTCVGADRDVREVFDAALPTMRNGALFVDHTTASAALARALHAEARAAGIGFLDAPVSGGQAGAEAGRLAIMVGGDAGDFARAEPALRAYGATIAHIGAAGAGQLAKMVNQICIAGVLQGLSEALAFGARAGLDMDQVIEVISQGAAGSWQMQNRGPTMVRGQFDFGFALDWMRKDLAIVLAEAGRNGAHLPLTALVDQFYGRLQRRGHGRWDTSALITLLED
jgi:3-hydroxyisobutyrate dehydrogenase-like beta-hydroxyacid dehydrogenase